MPTYPEQLKKAIDTLARLPGLGPKSAERLVFYLVKNGNHTVDTLLEQLATLRRDIKVCSTCGNIDTTDPCSICRDTKRDHATLCVVAEPQDITVIERTGDFTGRYHVLGGVLNPVNNITPEKLRIDQLLKRIQTATPRISEVIIATNPDLEGESTAMYLARKLKPLQVKLTRLAKGLPMGATIEYADEITISNALKGRQPL